MTKNTIIVLIAIGISVALLTIPFPVYLPLTTWWDYVAALTIPACLLIIVLGVFVVPFLRKKR